MRRTTTAALILALLAALPAAAQWPPEKTHNLEVFPKDVEVRELIGAMRQFSFALGVRCQHCHEGEPDQPLPTIDFASDAREAKGKAREMLRMVEAINGDFLAGLESSTGVEVRCVTCHRGQAKPELIEDLVARQMEAEGFEAAAARYRELREEKYGSHTFDFSEWPLNNLADGMARGGKLAEAAQLLELNAEFHSESAYLHHLLGEIRYRLEDKEGAIAAFERSLELAPENPQAKQRLEELRAEE